MQQEAPARLQNVVYGFEGDGKIIDVLQYIDAEYCVDGLLPDQTAQRSVRCRLDRHHIGSGLTGPVPP